ncbi:hypothetical protein A7U60_g5453 [Sanghuangporus baumii]|uniref:Uncharacterized protein n=1 Tax=Sanghuangporus baumii TaxID=108892 RepID=A0A9Q5HWY8_SANBA|nr:hypothetical protein A7U60_g5453 [Sanghuangporus baumii]
MHARRRANTDVSETEQLFYFPRMDSLHHQQQQQQGAGLGTSSQGLVRHRNNLSSFSLSSHISLPNRVSTLEAYELIYGDGAAPGAMPTEAIERLYEANAGTCHEAVLRYRNDFADRMQYVILFLCRYPSKCKFLPSRAKRCDWLAETFLLCSYENPLVTASSRHIISEINALTRQLRELDVPRPLAMFKTLFRPSETYEEARESWFQVLRVWSEIDEMYDSESFDGHRLSIVEHTLNVLIFPGLHSDGRPASDVEVSSLVSLPTIGAHVTNPKPVLAIPGLRRLPLPSPLHLKLHVISRLSFNEQGRITRHRDFYDVRDVLALVPGVRAAQWIGTRAAAQGLAFASRLTGWVFGKKGGSTDAVNDSEDDVSPSVSPIYTSSSRRPDMNALGLHFSEGRSTGRPSRPCQAPDVDRDAE